MVEDGALPVLAILSKASAVIAEGEVLQLVTSNDVKTSEAAYLEVINAKTAQLFAAASRIGAVVACRPSAEEEALDGFGRNLGIAFQIIDDMLDYSALESELGKTVGDDFREGKITLPIVLALRAADERERQFWRRTLEDSEQRDGDLAHAIELMRRHGTLAATLERAREYGEAARRALAGFRDGPERQALDEVIEFVSSSAVTNRANTMSERRAHRYRVVDVYRDAARRQSGRRLLRIIRSRSCGHAGDRARAQPRRDGVRVPGDARRLRRALAHLHAGARDGFRRPSDDRHELGAARGRPRRARRHALPPRRACRRDPDPHRARRAAADLADDAAGAARPDLRSGAVRAPHRPRSRRSARSPAAMAQRRQSDRGDRRQGSGGGRSRRARSRRPARAARRRRPAGVAAMLFAPTTAGASRPHVRAEPRRCPKTRRPAARWGRSRCS